MKSKLFSSGLLLILVLGFSAVLMADKTSQAEKHPDADFSMSCKECHMEVTPDIYTTWAESGHGKMNFGCYMCHGDGQEEFYVKPGSDRCISCHSGHEKCIEMTGDGNCFDCHKGHSLKVEKKENKQEAK